jgi:N-acetylmuramoyl-L-alanine amidase
MSHLKQIKQFLASFVFCVFLAGASMTVSAADIPQEFSDEEIEMIEAVVMHEVGYCSRESMIAIAHVILNRVENPLFPDNVYQVLHQKGQFTAIHNYYDSQRPVTPKVRQAVSDALEMSDVTGGALYFYSPRYMSNNRELQWFQSLETTLIHEDVWYCK